MKKGSLAILAAFSIILAALLLAFPDLLLNPGPLMNGHRHLKRNCLACHRPFKGVQAVQCTDCHRPDSIGLRAVDGTPLNRNTTGATLHRGLPAGSCTECHTDHKGADARKAIRKFRHDAISASLRNDCNACHDRQKPADALHRSVPGRCAQCHDTGRWSSVLFNHNMLEARLSTACVTCHRGDRPADDMHRSVSGCGECHGTNRWRPATFDHAKATSSGRQCVSCHLKDRPSDELHRLSQASCGSCHGTGKWRPATFDHNRFFPLQGEHRSSCRTCHTDTADYRKYTCYGCHEHSPSRVASEHLEEGIRNYQNCIRCHRTGSKHGSEHGGERGWREGRHGDDD